MCKQTLIQWQQHLFRDTHITTTWMLCGLHLSSCQLTVLPGKIKNTPAARYTHICSAKSGSLHPSLHLCSLWCALDYPHNPFCALGLHLSLAQVVGWSTGTCVTGQRPCAPQGVFMAPPNINLFAKMSSGSSVTAGIQVFQDKKGCCFYVFWCCISWRNAGTSDFYSDSPYLSWCYSLVDSIERWGVLRQTSGKVKHTMLAGLSLSLLATKTQIECMF